MVMPTSQCADDISSDVKCDTFWLIGERIRTVACNGVKGCVAEDCDRPFSSWQTEGPTIQDPHGESLVVTFLRAGPKPSSQRTSGPLAPAVVLRCEYRVELRENGWPTLTVEGPDATIKTPDWKLYHKLSKHARGHGEKMYRALVNAAATTRPDQMMFKPTINPHVMNNGVSVTDLVPLENPGPQCGYRCTVTVETKLS